MKEGIHTKEGGKEQTHITGALVEGQRRNESAFFFFCHKVTHSWKISMLSAFYQKKKKKSSHLSTGILKTFFWVDTAKSLETTFILMMHYQPHRISYFSASLLKNMTELICTQYSFI